MRGNWVEEFNYTMKKLQLIRQIIEFSMTLFFGSVSSCRVAACAAASNVFHQTTIELMTVRSHIIIVACPATAHATPFVPGWGSGGGLVWPTTMSCSMKTCFLWWIYIFLWLDFYHSRVVSVFWFSILDREWCYVWLMDSPASLLLIGILFCMFLRLLCVSGPFFCVIRSFLPSEFTTALPPWSSWLFLLFSNWIRVSKWESQKDTFVGELTSCSEMCIM